MNKDIILRCNQVQKRYNDLQIDNQILNGVDLNVYKGEKIAILGISGSGKTTLLNLLAGLDLPTSGYIELMGVNYSKKSINQRAKLRNQWLGFVYQLHHLLPDFTALENVMMPLMIKNNIPRSVAQEKATEILTKTGLFNRIMHRPSALSGGERQRVAIARALVTKPKCVLADEPTGNLDSKRSEDIFSMMTSLSDENGTSFIVVTHDEKLAKKMDKIYMLDNGVLTLNQ